MHAARLNPGTEVTHDLGPGRGAYVYLIDGRVTIDDEALSTGDAAKITNQPTFLVRAIETSELILVDVPLEFEPAGIWRGRI